MVPKVVWKVPEMAGMFDEFELILKCVSLERLFCRIIYIFAASDTVVRIVVYGIIIEADDD